MRLRRRPGATLDDVVEVLHGIRVILMDIRAKLEGIARQIRGDDDDDEADS